MTVQVERRVRNPLGQIRARAARGLSALVVATLVAGCVDLPTADVEKIQLTLRAGIPDQVFVGDTVKLAVSALDPSGQKVHPPPLEVSLVYEETDGQASIVWDTVKGDGYRVAGVRMGRLVLDVAVPPGNALFTADGVQVETLVRYGPLDVSFPLETGYRELDARGPFELRTRARDHHNGTPREGDYILEIRPGTAVVDDPNPQYLAGLRIMQAVAPGQDTLILSHSACYDPCGDTLVVTVNPVAVRLAMPPGQDVQALGDTLALRAFLADANGFEVQGPAPVWSHVDPAADATLELVDALAGLAVSRQNGYAVFEARVDSLSGTVLSQVKQRFAPGWRFLEGPRHLVTDWRDSVHVWARDYRGNPLAEELTWALDMGNWEVDPPAIGAIGAGAATFASVYGQQSGYGSVLFHTRECADAGDCQNVTGAFQVRVIPEPDSVVAYPLDVGVVTVLGPSGVRLWGDIFLSDELIDRVQLRWTGLDPSVATVDREGFITGVANGTARFEGRMGASTDTVSVSVAVPGG